MKNSFLLVATIGEGLMVIWVNFNYFNITYVGFDFNVSTLASVGNMLTFMVGSKQAFEVSLPHVAQTQMQRNNRCSHRVSC